MSYGRYGVPDSLQSKHGERLCLARRAIMTTTCTLSSYYALRDPSVGRTGRGALMRWVRSGGPLARVARDGAVYGSNFVRPHLLEGGVVRIGKVPRSGRWAPLRGLCGIGRSRKGREVFGGIVWCPRWDPLIFVLTWLLA